MANTYRNATIDLTTTSQTTIYTCPTNTTALVKTIQLTNETGNVNVQVYVTDSSVPTTVEIAHITMSARSTDTFAKGTIILEAGDIIKITAATANTITGIISVLEVSY